jgi:hypothetical protein
MTIRSFLRFHKYTLLSLLLVVAGTGIVPTLRAQPAVQQRVIVLTDIEADPDDTQSLVRLLLYSNEIDIRGLVATTSVHMKDQIHPESIERVIRAYGAVVANLRTHAPGYPSPDTLLARVKSSTPRYGMNGVGAGQATAGSDWIIRELDRPDERPLWISVWGGANTLAQALYTLRETRPAAEVDRLVAKLRVYTISDQDDSAIWIRENFPELFYIVSPGGYGSATWIAITQYIPGIDNTTIGNSWLANHIQQGHGPLGAIYPDVAYGMEGDTPAWLALIPNGLNAPEHPDWGGWGGRYEYYQPAYAEMDTAGFTGGVPVPPEPRPIWTNASDTYTPFLPNEYGRAVRPDTTTFAGNRVTLWRWRDDFQRDFAARMDWCRQPYAQANHPPVPQLAHPDELTVPSGAWFWLDAAGTHDPDGDALSYLWMYYPEAGTMAEEAFRFQPAAPNLYRLPVAAPVVTEPQTLHFILKVTDKGTPALSRYRRVRVTVRPE